MTTHVSTVSHPGQTCYIIATGPSLVNLQASDIGPGPIIAINRAILAVEALGLDTPLMLSPVYSMQKDGCWTPRGEGNAYQPKTGACPPGFCDKAIAAGTYFRPRHATLIVHEHESRECLKDYSPRLIFDAVADCHRPWGTMSAICAVIIALDTWGCSDVALVSFDALTRGDVRAFREDSEHSDVSNDAHTEEAVILRMFLATGQALGRIRWRTVTPEGEPR